MEPDWIDVNRKKTNENSAVKELLHFHDPSDDWTFVIPALAGFAIAFLIAVRNSILAGLIVALATLSAAILIARETRKKFAKRNLSYNPYFHEDSGLLYFAKSRPKHFLGKQLPTDLLCADINVLGSDLESLKEPIRELADQFIFEKKEQMGVKLSSEDSYQAEPKSIPKGAYKDLIVRDLNGNSAEIIVTASDFSFTPEGGEKTIVKFFEEELDLETEPESTPSEDESQVATLDLGVVKKPENQAKAPTDSGMPPPVVDVSPPKTEVSEETTDRNALPGRPLGTMLDGSSGEQSEPTNKP